MAMSISSAAPGKSTRRWLAGGTAAALVFLGVPVLSIAPAQAVTFGGFEVDANLKVQGAEDWMSYASAASPGLITLVDNSVNNQGAFDGKDDTSFNSSFETGAGGANDWPNWAYDAGQVTKKNDFGRIALTTRTVAMSGTDHQFAFFAFDRGGPDGTGKFSFELNQVKQTGGTATTPNANPDRTQGDVRLVIADQGNGQLGISSASDPDVGYFRWDDPDEPGDQTVAGSAPDSNRNGSWKKMTAPANSFEGSINTADIVEPDFPSWWTTPNFAVYKNGPDAGKKYIPADQFVEFGFDLTALGAILGCPSLGYSTANIRSLTGTGTGGTLMDYIKPLDIDIPSTCATMVLTKTNPDGTPLPGTVITVTPNPTTGTGSATYTTGADGSVTITGVKPGTYTIEETTAPKGYILVPWKQTITVKPSATFSYTFVNPLGDVAWTKAYEGYDAQGSFPGDFTGQQFTVKRMAGIALSDGEFQTISGIAATGCTTACTFTVRDNGARDADDTWGAIRVNDLPVGTYEITETEGGQPDGFGPDSATVTVQVPDKLGTAPLAEDGKTVINYLVEATTGFENPRLTGALQVKKVDAADASVTVPKAEFDLYQVVGDPDVTSSETDDVKINSASIVTGADGTAQVDDLAWGFSYYFVETYAPAPYNIPDENWTGTSFVSATDATEGIVVTLTLADPQSEIETDAVPSYAAGGSVTLPGAEIYDTAVLSGLNSKADGTVTFELWGPFESATLTDVCQVTTDGYTEPADSSTVGIEPGPNGTFTATSDTFAPTEVGFYYWVASYSGDENGNSATAGECGDPREISQVKPAQPGIVTLAKGDTALAPTATIYDTATVSGLTGNATTTDAVTFTLYGPVQGDTAVCTAQVGDAMTVDLGPVMLDPKTGEYFAEAESPQVTVSEAGTYYWIAEYAGDANNLGDAGECGDAGEQITIEKAQPSIATEASAEGEDTQLPSVKVSDRAVVSGLAVSKGEQDLGDVTFVLYGPFTGDEAADVCTAGVEVATVALTEVEGEWVAAVPTAQSVTEAGRYRWIATYNGDEDNLPIAGECLDPLEMVTVTPAQPEIVTVATDGNFAAGGSTATISDTAYLKGLAANATGTVVFEAFGPFTQTAPPFVCEGPSVGTVVKTLVGTNAEGVTLTFTAELEVDQAGTYAWVATYDPGDDPNNLGDSHECGAVDATTVPAMDEVSVVGKAQPSIVTRADTGLVLGAAADAKVQAGDTAEISGLTAGATGTVTFVLYGPVDTSLEVPCIDDSEGSNIVGTVTAPLGTVSEEGTATVTSPKLDLTEPGAYFWVASYGGDDNNLPIAGQCGEEGETTVVTRTGIPGLDKSSPNEQGPNGTPNGNVAPGSTIDYTITLTNTGGLPVTDNLVDTLPAGVTDPRNFERDGVADAPDTIAGQVLTWNNVTVNAGKTVVFTLQVTVTEAPGPGEFTDLPNKATWAGLLDRTLHIVVGPGVEITPTLDKDSNPADGSEVAIGSVITYTVKLGNDGNVAVTGDLVDTLPSGIEVVGGYTRDDGGKATPDTVSATSLVWKAVTVQPDQVVTFTYQIKVLNSALDADSLVNTAEWLDLTDGTEHTVKQPDLPVTGSGVNPFAVAGWAGAILGLGLLLLLTGRSRRDGEA